MVVLLGHLVNRAAVSGSATLCTIQPMPSAAKTSYITLQPRTKFSFCWLACMHAGGGRFRVRIMGVGGGSKHGVHYSLLFILMVMIMHVTLLLYLYLSFSLCRVESFCLPPLFFSSSSPSQIWVRTSAGMARRAGHGIAGRVD